MIADSPGQAERAFSNRHALRTRPGSGRATAGPGHYLATSLDHDLLTTTSSQLALDPRLNGDGHCQPELCRL